MTVGQKYDFYPRAERRGGVIGRKHDYAYAVVPVKEVIGGDKFLRDRYRQRVAPVVSETGVSAVGKNKK